MDELLKPTYATPTDETRFGVGRPSKYWKCFCEDFIKHCSEGKSIDGFGAFLGNKYGPDFLVCRETVNAWKKEHSEFSDAIKVGKMVKFAYMEGVLIKGINGEIENFKQAACIFWFKTQAGWRERLELTGKDGEPLNFSDLALQVWKKNQDKEQEQDDGEDNKEEQQGDQDKSEQGTGGDEK